MTTPELRASVAQTCGHELRAAAREIEMANSSASGTPEAIERAIDHLLLAHKTAVRLEAWAQAGY